LISGAYSGIGPDLLPPTPQTIVRMQEWKTPPLWGLADSAPYLHDGRAATIEEAITFHGGERGPSGDRYIGPAGGGGVGGGGVFEFTRRPGPCAVAAGRRKSRITKHFQRGRQTPEGTGEKPPACQLGRGPPAVAQAF